MPGVPKHANPGTPLPSRHEILDDAGRALGKGQFKDALKKLVGLLEHDARDPATHVKAAEVYARLKQPAKAREHFGIAAQIYVEKGFEAKALGVYRNSVSIMPDEVEFWEAICGWHRSHGYLAEAVKTLLEARSHFVRRRQRPQAARLLRAVLEIEPWQYEATMDLAGLSRGMGERTEARRYYQGLAERVQGARLRRVRGALFTMSPTPAAVWRWLRAATLGR